MWENFEKFDAQVEQRVNEVVNTALEKALDNTNTATDHNIAKQASDLKAEVAGLKASLAAALKALKDGGGGGGGGGGMQQGQRLVIQQ